MSFKPTISDEIDLIELLKKIYLKKKFIFKTSIFAALFGVVFALFQPNEFTSSTTFIPQLEFGCKNWRIITEWTGFACWN